MLREMIEERLEEIIAEINKSTGGISLETLKKLEQFADSVLADQSNIEKYQIDEFVDKVYENNTDIDIKAYKEKLNTFKKLVQVKAIYGDDMFDLTESQKEFIQKFCKDTKDFVVKTQKEISSNDSLDSEKTSYNKIIQKMDNNERLMTDDLDNVFDMISGLDNDDQIKVLKDFLQYNIKALELEKKQEKATTNIESITKTKTDIANVVDRIKKYETSKKRIKTFEETIDIHKEEIMNNMDINNITAIIDFFKEKSIYDKFAPETLLAVLAYGTEDSVKVAYDEFKSKTIGDTPQSWADMEFVYEFPGLWTVQEDVKRKSYQYRGEKGGPGDTASLKSKVNQLLRKDLYKKVQLLQACGVKDTSLDRCAAALKTSYDTMVSQLKVYEKYHLFVLDNGKNNIDVKPSTFVAGHRSVERCDKAIECGLLNANAAVDDRTHSAYVNHNPSFLLYTSYNENDVMLFEFLNDSGQLNQVFKFNKNGAILSKKEVEHLKSNFGIIKNSQQFMNDNGIVTTSSDTFGPYKAMHYVTNIDVEDKLDFRDDTIKSDFIKNLDSKYKENDYKYSYNGKIISRYKVLRLYQTLQDYNAEVESDDRFDESDIRFFAMTYGTYFDQSVYDQLKDECYKKNIKGAR